MGTEEQRKMVEETNELKCENAELKMKVDKAEAQMRIARIAMASMIIVTIFLLSPFGPTIELIKVLETVLATFYVAMASIVGAYMGFTAWMSRK